jgi:Secretion system C-terminal sorting domain
LSPITPDFCGILNKIAYFMKKIISFQRIVLALFVALLHLVPALAQQNQKVILPTPQNAFKSSASTVRLTADGGYFLTGLAQQVPFMQGASGTTIPRVVKMDANLQTEWDNLYLQPQPGNGALVTVTGDLELPNGDFLISLNDDSTQTDLIRLAPNGNLLWSKALPDFTGVKIIGLLPNGNVLATRAYYSNGWKTALVHLDNNGDIIYNKDMPIGDALILANGDILFQYKVTGTNKKKIIRCDNLGNIIWESQPSLGYTSTWTAMPNDGFAMIGISASDDLIVRIFNGLGDKIFETDKIPNNGGTISRLHAYPDGSFLISGTSNVQIGYMMRFEQDTSVVWVVESPTDNQAIQTGINGIPTVDGWAVGASDGDGYDQNFGILRARANTGFFTNVLTGRMAKDDDDNCFVDANEGNIWGARVIAKRTNSTQTWTAFTGPDGYYSLPLPAGDFTLSAQTHEPFFSLCPTAPVAVSFAPNANNTSSLDLPMQAADQIHQISGHLVIDANDNCIADAGELPLAGWSVGIKFNNKGIRLLTDANGYYSIFLPDGDYTIFVQPYNFNFGICNPSNVVVNFNSTTPLSQTVDFVSFKKTDCSLMQASLGISPVRTCTSATVRAYYRNDGTKVAENATMTVFLDPALTFISASVTPNSVVGNTLFFELGDVAPTQSGTSGKEIQISVATSCNLEIGNQVCMTANVSPSEFCGNSTNPQWNGAIVAVTGECLGDSTKFTIQNIGNAPNSGPLEYVIAEDQIVLKQGTFQLPAGGSQFETVLATMDTTVTITAQQEPGFPGAPFVSYSVTNCMGFGSNPSGYGNPPSPFTTQSCREVIGSYDPNDKSAFPVGYGAEHFIRPETPLQYNIRFQNTGTDTAFLVVLRDTLSPYLDPSTLRVQSASHAYETLLLSGNILQFTFKNILLPDSTTNLEASQGFVSYRIIPQPDLAVGTVINNRAGIYFDFNEPIMTNTTWHTIGGDLISVSVDGAIGENATVKVWPNPSVGTVYFELPNTVQNGRFTLTDNVGKTVANQTISDTTFQFERGQLPQGVYFFTITGSTGVITGKIVLE